MTRPSGDERRHLLSRDAASLSNSRRADMAACPLGVLLKCSLAYVNQMQGASTWIVDCGAPHSTSGFPCAEPTASQQHQETTTVRPSGCV